MTKDPAARAYHHGNLKPALIEAGLEMLESDGLKNLSLRAVAARVGVSHTAPKNHFGSLRGFHTALATEGFRRHRAYMQDSVGHGATRGDALLAALSGYVRFAREFPQLFELMFSPMFCDHDAPDLAEAASGSYAVLRTIATGLDWDKADASEGQYRTEMMLWSFVHGYATLMNAGQFSTGPDGTPLFGPNEVIPSFDYRD